MRLALETARECEAPMPLASLLHDRFLAAMARGQSELDWTSVAKIAASDAGL
jgi:3-hydroxyisobutyrate dehydrogenase-like beta-hydroxyacid dehydrogenase